jgi:hypothetical protein
LFKPLLVISYIIYRTKYLTQTLFGKIILVGGIYVKKLPSLSHMKGEKRQPFLLAVLAGSFSYGNFSASIPQRSGPDGTVISQG